MLIAKKSVKAAEGQGLALWSAAGGQEQWDNAFKVLQKWSGFCLNISVSGVNGISAAGGQGITWFFSAWDWCISQGTS